MDPSAARGRPEGCLRAEFEFIVDSLGFVELGSIKPAAGNDRDFYETVKFSIGELRYTPARLEGRPVRQIVT